MPDQGDIRNPERLAEALRHVEMGFGAFSCWPTDDKGVCKCVKGTECVSGGKHPIPRDGFRAASTDPKMVTAMMTAAVEPNYGLVWPEGDDVVFSWDIDGPDWKQRMADLASTFGKLPPTKTTKTPNGGLHLYYRWPQGVPIPEGNHLHGFIVRWPMKGYVVGPGSRINGKMYQSVGTDSIATLPMPYAAHEVKPKKEPLFTVTDDEQGYTLPTSIPTGTRHDAIAAYVASRWNRGLSFEEVAAAVRSVLVPLFAEAMDEARLADEIKHAWDTCEKGGWEKTFGEQPKVEFKDESTGEQIVIDPLDVGDSTDRNVARLNVDDIWLPAGLLGLISHLETLCDAPSSSLLLASVCTMSALVGPKPSLNWRGTNRASVFGVMVGEPNFGRKGTALRVVENAFAQVEPMLHDITKSGIASSEKLIDLLNESKNNTLGSLLVRQQELASVLTIAAREGNTLSATLRETWDGDTVQTHSRAKGSTSAAGYHMALIAGTNPKDLRTSLSGDDLGNGWANRFLWFWAEKSSRTFDDSADDTLDPSLRDWLRDCIDFARRLGGSPVIAPRHTMTLDPAALDHLRTLAASLDVRPDGWVMALRQRMTAHIVRIAMVSALFDKRSNVTLDDVGLGEAMTDYAVASTRAVFGNRVSSEVGAHILAILRQAPDGMNTSTLSKLLRQSGSKTIAALQMLVDDGIIEREKVKTDRAPAVVYRVRKVHS